MQIRIRLLFLTDSDLAETLNCADPDPHPTFTLNSDWCVFFFSLPEKSSTVSQFEEPESGLTIRFCPAPAPGLALSIIQSIISIH